MESSVHYRLSSLSEGCTKTPIGLIHLNSATEPLHSLSLEFTQEELFNFHQVLENIQNKLDQIV